MTDPSQVYCVLCRAPASLQQSHIIPSFVYRWLKDTSVTGHLRAAENPKKRVQDGLKTALLCANCEARFNPWETAFATKVFYPYSADQRMRVRYHDWMLKFCVSVSWRVLKFIQLETGLRGWSDHQRSEGEKALQRWEAFIFGKAADPGPYEQHLLPLGAMERSTVPNLPENMNRYLMRSVEIDTPHGDRTAFTYAKMGRFALFGTVVPPSRKWEGTRVAVKTGSIGPGRFVLPRELLDYLKERAHRSAELYQAIPSHQLDKIEAGFMRDPQRVVRTDEFSAMLEDERMFGTNAILRTSR